MAVASLKMFAVTGTVTAMGLRSGLTLISLIVLGAGLSGCGADGPTCSGGAKDAGFVAVVGADQIGGGIDDQWCVDDSDASWQTCRDDDP